jgi:hypothetical protein
MSQRSLGNDRNRKDGKTGHTRKSAAGAKPIRKQGTVEVSKSSAKPKKAGTEKDWSGLPTSPEIKKWRRVWWVLLLSGLALIGGSYAIPELRDNESVLKVVSVVVLALSMAAIAIDLVVIRKLRKELMAQMPKKKSSKHDGKGTA